MRHLLAIILVFAALGPIPSFGGPHGPEIGRYTLLHRRPGKITGGSDTADIIIVGDTMFSRSVSVSAGKYGFDAPLLQVAPWLESADLAVANYEGTIALGSTGARREGPYRFKANPEAAAALAKAGFNLVSLANNHSMDWGSDALKATVKYLDKAGVKTVGAGAGPEDAARPRVTVANGVRVVWLAFNAVGARQNMRTGENGWVRSWLGEDSLTNQVQRARDLGDAVIVLLHWGREYLPYPDSRQIRLAKSAVDAGADLVVGHHPHVVQKAEAYKGGFIVYSLGNFLFDQRQEAGLGLWVRVDRDGIIDIHGLTVHPGVRPEWHDPAHTRYHLGKIHLPGKISSLLNNGKVEDYELIPVGSSDLELPGLPITAAREKEIGRIDITGDGVPERVTTGNGRLKIYSEGHVVYMSEPDWIVTDAALGDPDTDGRYEVMMLLVRQDGQAGEITTNPFIVGYREGQYKVIWGGAATIPWLHAIEVADVDGDSLDELITIERDKSASLFEPTYQVTVTKWNGWGFTRSWASEYGRYMDLVVSSGKQGKETMVLHVQEF